MTGELSRLTLDGVTATLTLDRPERRNALSVALLDSLHRRLDELERDEQSVVVLVRGEGRAFCAGMDLMEVLADRQTPRRLLESLARLTLRIRRLRQVTVASVHGAAIGGGCGLACVCDLAFTHAGAKLGFPEVDLGLCPAVVAPWVVRRVGPARARAILLRGGLISGERAAELGLVNQSLDDEHSLHGAVQACAESIAAGGPAALAATKRLLNELDGSLDEALLLRGATLSAEVLLGDEAQNALRERFGA